MMSYELDLKSVGASGKTFSYEVGDDFFQSISNSLIERGKVDVDFNVVRKAEGVFTMHIRVNGTVEVPCDRCLDPVAQPIAGEYDLRVEYDDHDEVQEDRVLVADNRGTLDLKAVIYDYVNLAIPMTHVHAEGECNGAMADKLKEYMVN